MSSRAVVEVAAAPLIPDDGFGRGVVRLYGPGPGLWRSFSRSIEALDGGPDPLDRWSDRIGAALAAERDAELVSLRTNDPAPPVLRWLLRSGRAHPSPIGPLVGDSDGLWLSVRFGLIDRRADATATSASSSAVASPCAACPERPCRMACPVGAFTPAGYDAEACARHVAGPDSERCAELGCAARRACRVGSIPEPARAAFHMTAFLRGRRACAD